jgi:DNA-binding LytR/AlgR family response regulator
MKIVIIEDEEFAARRLERMINEIDPDIQIVAKLESVTGSVEWFRNNSFPDLIFMDIHLEDNLSFAIFDTISVSCPIVFTTATDETSTRAFKLKKIDYLLKPIVREELAKLIEKYRELPQGENRLLNAAFFSEIISKS